MAAIVQHFLADGATAITGVQLVNILAGTTGTALKFGVKNVVPFWDTTAQYVVFHRPKCGNHAC